MTHEKTDNFYNQKMHLTNIRYPRFEFFRSLCGGKKVLHIGAADAMVFNPESNLHIYLSKLKDGNKEEERAATERVKKALVERTKARGKIRAEEAPGNEELAKAEFEWAQADIALTEIKNRRNTQIDAMDIDVEALEVLNKHCPGVCFSSYEQIKDTYQIVLVPEVMEHVPNVKGFLDSIFSINSTEYLFTVPSIFSAQLFCDDTFTLEMVHQDHKYWFSPYTLYNTMRPYMRSYNVEMYYLEGKSQVGIRLYKKTPEELSAQEPKPEISE